MRFAIIVLLLCIFSRARSEEQRFKLDLSHVTVLELDDSNFDAAIATFDYILVDFYAPWCGHCKRLAPQLDAAAPILAQLKEPVWIAKVDADKHTRLARKHEIDAFPTLKIFMHGIPVEYHGPRQAELLVQYLKKFVAPDVSVLDSDASINDFVESAGTFFPVFIGFGLNENVISDLAAKYKKKAWFSVAKDFSEDLMVLYDFDKVPALVVIHRSYDNQQSVFYGPFEEGFLGDFVKQNFLPKVVQISEESLNVLKDDERKIVLTIVADETEEKSKKLIKTLKAAASANHDLVFGYVGVEQWEEFTHTFGADNTEKLPKMVIWSGTEEYTSVIGSESLEEEDQGTQISTFLEGYRKGRIEVHRVKGPSLMGFINSLIGIRTVYIIVFLVAMLMLIRSIGKDEEPLRVGSRQPSDDADGSQTETYSPGEKED